jgi:hypothetical protein
MPHLGLFQRPPVLATPRQRIRHALLFNQGSLDLVELCKELDVYQGLSTSALLGARLHERKKYGSADLEVVLVCDRLSGLDAA